MCCIAHPTNHLLTPSTSDMVVALEPSYYLTASDVENVVKSSKDFSITQGSVSYHDLFVRAVELPDDEVCGLSSDKATMLTL